MLTIAGAVEFPSGGTVEILGERLGQTLVHQLRERIGFVDARAGTRFSPALTVEQVVATGATQTIGWFPERVSADVGRRAAELCERFGIDAVSGRRFADCSHGERARTLIARALVPRPRLLLLDEPGEGLDLPGRELLLQALDTLARDEPELALVLTTHHLEELPSSTTHALLLRGGDVVAGGPASTSLTSESLTACFGLPVTLHHAAGRWAATAGECPPPDFL